MNTTTTTTKSELRLMEDMAQTLNGYTVPMELIDAADTSTTTTATNHVVLMDEYTKVRDTYLQRKLVQNVIEHVMTKYDISDPSGSNTPIVLSKEDENDLTQRQERTLSMITNRASHIQQKRYELQKKYNHFQQRREEFHQYLDQMQSLQSQQNDNDTSLIELDENNMDTTMEYEHQMVLQETKIQNLHVRQTQLQVQLQMIQQQYKDATQKALDNKLQLQQQQQESLLRVSRTNTNKNDIEDTGTTVSSSSDNNQFDCMKHNSVDDPDEDKVQLVLQENSTLQTNLDQMNEIKDFYSNLCTLLEELYGMRFIRTTTTTSQQLHPNDNNDINHHHHDSKFIVVTVEFLKKYTIDITLGIVPSSSRSFNQSKGSSTHNNNMNVSCIIQSAILTSDNAIVSGPPIISNNNSNNDNSNTEHPDDDDNSKCIGDMVVQLRIPNFNDIVQYVNTTYNHHITSSGGDSSFTGSCNSGENLRVLFREILFRITMIEERVRMFTELQQEPGVVATVGPFCTTSGKDGISTMLHDQEIVCSLNHPPMTMVLRCTGNCPLMDNSIYIDELHGIGSGWDVAMVNDIQQRITAAGSSMTTASSSNGQYYRTPIDIIHAVQNEVQRLVDDELLIVPGTPRLPIRNNNTKMSTAAEATTTTTTTTSGNTKAFFG